MMPPIDTTFHAVCTKLTTDGDGETKITLTVSLQDLAAVLKLLSWTGSVLVVTVHKEGTRPGETTG